MKVNADKIFSKFQHISESIDRLGQFRDISRDEFEADQDSRDIASFRLIVATEAAIDICLHISSRLLKKVPEEYAACFKLLADHGVINEDLALRLARMARFRNLLVHHYWKIDYSRMYEILTGPDLEDLNQFMHVIGELIEEKKGLNRS
jgi:uncharacterized protein YutE (UPF0331/DUF86 family)